MTNPAPVLHGPRRLMPAMNMDGVSERLVSAALPSVPLMCTDGTPVDLSELAGLSVVFCYARSTRPGERTLPDGYCPPWPDGSAAMDDFRMAYDKMSTAGADRVFGLSTQSPLWQAETLAAFELPFALLSDEDCAFADALDLPTYAHGDERLLQRLTFIARDGVIETVIFPVFPTKSNANTASVHLLG